MSNIESTEAEPAGNEELIIPVPRVSIHVFHESSALATLAGNAAQDRRMQKAMVRLEPGGIAAALAAYRAEQAPNVIILETGPDQGAFLANLDSLAEFCDSGTRVVVVGRSNDISFYRTLLARGVSEYLVEPIDLLGFIRAISSLYATPGANPLGRIIAVYGAKGGVGSSTVAHHMAWSIATKVGIPTVVADLDLPFGTGGLDFNQDPAQGIAEAVYAPNRLDSNMLDRLMTKCNDSLHLVAAPATLGRNYDFDEAAFDDVVDLLRASAPIVVLDMPHVWTAWSRHLLVSVDEVIIVAAPDLANLRNVKNLLDVLKSARANDAKPRLVMNMVGLPKRPEIAVKEFTSAIEIEPAVVIPFDAKMFGTAANNGQMVGEVGGGQKMASLFETLGRLASGKPEIQKAKKSGLLDSFKSPTLSGRFAKKS